MGWRDYTKEYTAEMKAAALANDARIEADIRDSRERLARKIVMKLVDDIITSVIRPGPIAEERECYDMARELRALTEHLETVTAQIINVNGGVK